MAILLFHQNIKKYLVDQISVASDSYICALGRQSDLKTAGIVGSDLKTISWVLKFEKIEEFI